MRITRPPTVVIDCPDALGLAGFYATLLGWSVDERPDADDWVQVRDGDGHVISFQQVDDYRAPVWPTQEHPQQMHLDVFVDDLDAGEAAALAAGAGKHEHQPGGDEFRVFLDPAGHPFCLCVA